MSQKFDVQVPKEQYYDKYDNLSRFISYFYQIDLIKKINPSKVLEIGIGNKTVANYLKQSGMELDTCDFDKGLKPDYIADIRDLPFKDQSYDLVVAAEVIEHIPWEDVDKALSELNRVSKNDVLISIPYSSVGFELAFKFPLIHRILKKPFLNAFIRIPLFFIGIEFAGEHYWEMGRKGYPIRKIRKKFREYFIICEEVRPALNYYHHFFILKKK